MTSRGLRALALGVGAIALLPGCIPVLARGHVADPAAPAAVASASIQAQAPEPGAPPKPEVCWMMSPNCDWRPAGSTIDMIVVHDTQSPGIDDARAIARYFGRLDSCVSAHYIVGKDGTVIQCVPDELRAWHAGASYYQGQDQLNNRSIGIELVNAETGRDPFTEAQYRSLVQLVSYLVARYHIPMERIVGHKDITLRPEVKHDPARNFSWARLFGGVELALKRPDDMQAGGTLHEPPGQPVSALKSSD